MFEERVLILSLDVLTIITHFSNFLQQEVALASLALLVATSAPEQKDIIIKLVMNMLVEEI